MTLKNIRRKNKLTLNDLAKQINIAPSTLCKYENGAQRVPDDIKHILNTYFNTSIEYPEVYTIKEYNKLKENYNTLKNVYKDLLYEYNRLLKLIRNIQQEFQQYE